MCSTGNGLRYCASDADQCCTPPYITSVENQVRVNMQRSLRNEFDNVIDGYLDDFEDLIDCKATLYLVAHDY